MFQCYPLSVYGKIGSLPLIFIGKKKWSLFLIFCFVSLTFSYGQFEQSSSAISFGVRGTDYFSNYHSQKIPNSFNRAFQVNYYQQLNLDFLQLKFPLVFGKATVMDKDVYYNDVAINQTYYSFGSAIEMQIFREKKKVNPYISLGGSYTHVGDGGNHFEIPFGTGIDIQVKKYVAVQMNFEYRTAKEEYRNNLGVFVGVKIDLERKETYHELIDGDLDDDGIVDILDKCPNVPGVSMLDGCPDDYAIRNKEEEK